ncbi:MAG: hypothetical protein IJ614_09345 [Prevotella sp.]|nr:hypothetical protein [Prevotella sp.]
MTHRQSISTSISRLAISLLLLVMAVPSSHAQLKKMFRMEEDSIPLFRGFAVSFDLVGPAMLMLSDHGEYEGALRINLHDQWFPVFELGLGRANHEKDEVTGLTYKTTAPYFRVGMDWNILRRKHQANRLYAGFRYAFTSYKCDIVREDLPDPVWQGQAGFGIDDLKCSQHWMEVVFGIDAKVFGPLHLGWNIRYKRRLHHSDVAIGQTWYVPGFGTYDKDQIAANFNVIIDI